LVDADILNLRVQQGRMLAILATILVPALIVVVGIDKGYQFFVVAGALLIWNAGVAAWLAFSWRWLKPGTSKG
jgi:hypothetical protein